MEMRDDLLKSSPIDGASLAFPGPFDYQSGVSLMRHKLPYLYGVPLRSRLAGALGCSQSRISFCNDADAFLLGELSQLPHPGGRSVGVTLGTGVGSAFAVNGNICAEGGWCPARRRDMEPSWNGGLLEDAVSGVRIIDAFCSMSGTRSKEVAEVAGAARDGNLSSRAAFEEYGRLVGAALGHALKAFRPSTIFVGGGISKAAEFFLPSLMQAVDFLQARVVVSADSKSSAVLGACLHWRDGVVSRT